MPRRCRCAAAGAFEKCCLTVKCIGRVTVQLQRLQAPHCAVNSYLPLYCVDHCMHLQLFLVPSFCYVPLLFCLKVELQPPPPPPINHAPSAAAAAASPPAFTSWRCTCSSFSVLRFLPAPVSSLHRTLHVFFKFTVNASKAPGC